VAKTATHPAAVICLALGAEPTSTETSLRKTLYILKRAPHIQSNEPYTHQKEPYIHRKHRPTSPEVSLHKTAVYNNHTYTQKSSFNRGRNESAQNSPMYTQKSLVNTQKSSICTQKRQRASRTHHQQPRMACKHSKELYIHSKETYTHSSTQKSPRMELPAASVTHPIRNRATDSERGHRHQRPASHQSQHENSNVDKSHLLVFFFCGIPIAMYIGTPNNHRALYSLYSNKRALYCVLHLRTYGFLDEFVCHICVSFVFFYYMCLLYVVLVECMCRLTNICLTYRSRS